MGSGTAYDGKNWVDTRGADWQHPRGPNSSISGKDDYPVVQISMDDAVAFCKWASEVTGRRIQLPTEAQWEKAARGPSTGSGSTGSGGARLYPWGNQPPNNNLANYNMNAGGDTSPVGQYSPQGDSPYGAADMAGNAWEWTSTIYKSYPYVANDGREDATSREARVLRGGAYYFRCKACACPTAPPTSLSCTTTSTASGSSSCPTDPLISCALPWQLLWRHDS